jgi:hypothetical protein
MDDHTEGRGVSDQYTRSSPWPLFVALGFTLSEAGVLFNFLSVAVGGILLFAASVVGILRESGYARTLWRPTVGAGVAFGAAGGALLSATSFTFRGTYVGAAGAFLVGIGAVLFLHETGRL